MLLDNFTYHMTRKCDQITFHVFLTRPIQGGVAPEFSENSRVILRWASQPPFPPPRPETQTMPMNKIKTISRSRKTFVYCFHHF